jgi:hypothetical protein
MCRVLLFIRACLLGAVAGLIWLNAISRAADNAGASATPRQVWDVYQHAITEGKFAVAFDCLTPAAQEEQLEQCILSSLMLAEQIHDAKDVPKEFERLRDRLQALLRSNGLDLKQSNKVLEAAQAARPDVDLTEERTRELVLGQLKGDRRKFFGGAMSITCEFERLMAEKYKEASAGAAESRKAGGAGDGKDQPEVQVLGVKVREDRAVMAIRRPLSDGSVLMHGSLRVRYTTETQYFRRIGSRWFLASESNEPVHAPLYVVKESGLPYSRQFEMDCGDAIRLGLPNGREVALWCTGTPAIGQALGNGELTLSYGEKPFRSSPLKYRNLPDGGRWVEGCDSYIRQGGVTTFSGRSGCQRELFVGNYRILTDENAGKEGKLSLTVQIRVATPSERLYGDAEREHYLKQLKSGSLAEQREAINKLCEMVALHSHYMGEPNKMAEAVRPLLKHADGAVSTAAFDTLCCLGDEQTLLSLMTPAPKKPFRSIQGGGQIAEWNLRQDHESVRRRAVPFFDSKDPEQVAFAVGFFARAENPIAKKQMLAVWDHGSADIRAEVVGSLRFYCEAPEAARLLTKGLEDKNEKVILESLRAADWLIQYIPAKKITPHLKHRSREVREMACSALRSCRDAEAIGPLLEATGDKEPHVRGLAAEALGQLKATNAVDRLIEMLRDPVPEVRTYAIGSLRLLETPKASPALKRLLETETDENVRRMAKETLEQM